MVSQYLYWHCWISNSANKQLRDFLVNYIQVLKKYNRNKKGGVLSLWWQIFLYNIKFFFWRPIIIKLLLINRYRSRKKILYTILVGEYDHLNEIPKKMKNWDYVCFTDNPNLKSDTWQIRLLSNESDLDSVRLSRHYKIKNHLIDKGYDISVYIDANISIRGDLDCFLSHALPLDSSFAILFHPFLYSLEQEVSQCITGGKDREQLLKEQYEHYVTEECFNDRFPHINARMMIRRSGDEHVYQLMETWFAQLEKWSKRDQVSFNYSLSKSPGAEPTYVPYWIFRQNFKNRDHN